MLVPAKRNFFDDFMMSPFDAFFDAPQAQIDFREPKKVRKYHTFERGRVK